ncbi:MAG: hypothetical protein IKH77_08750 [Clostridia bacterium]|nr:hypothetical protein [Clostridia bacterium]
MADKKKSFTRQLDTAQLNPALQFISTPAPQAPRREAAQGRTPAAPAPAVPAPRPETAAPEGYRVNPMYIEKKTRRLQLLLRPSVYEAVRARAQGEGVSVNDLINTLLEEATK